MPYPLLHAFLACLWLLTAPLASAGEKVSVFVSILPQKYFVERIGAGQVAVSLLVGPGRSPETYEPTPQQMARLSRAQLFFRIGAPFEQAWMDRVRRNNPSLRIIDNRDGIALRELESAGDGDDADHGHKHFEGKDPHIWTSPPLVKQISAQIRDALVAAAPAYRDAFEANYARFAAELEALDREIQNRVAPLQQRSFMVFHPAWGYFADTYGLQQVPIEVAGKSPGPRALGHLIETARNEGIRVVFVQAQFSDRAARAVAQAIGGRVEAIDPLAYDFLANLRQVANLIAEAGH